MRWPTLAAATLVAVGLTGCDRIPFIGGGEEEAAATDTTTAQEPAEPAGSATEAPAASDTVAESVEPLPEGQQATPAQPEPQPEPQVQQPVAARVDEPWTPTQTGTIDNGMTRAEVVAVWGEPAAVSSQGEWVYLFYRNGCEATCGTADVVLLHQGQVVDAIVRGVGHSYAGVSSSPPGSPAQFTPPARTSGGVGLEG
ncbi:MAG: hypothetical protein JSW71_15760 [Gemmatimonadota bacterium]|nr:MAG: hypothetical protein JSW71_15760 [Gemmatimonadota bacterium]